MEQELSMHKTIHKIFLDNPKQIFTTKDLLNHFNNLGDRKTEKKLITQILMRLFRKDEIIRTPTQLTDGYYYSLNNHDLLNRVYENHLLPYHFSNRNLLIEQIRKNCFNEINNNKGLFDIDNFKELNFVKKYSLEHFQTNKTKEFLTMLAGFSMCDGHVSKKVTKCHFFFRRKSDAELFVGDFQKIFHLENFCIKPGSQGGCYVVSVLKSSNLAKLLQRLGSPAGNKVFQPFLVPDWIYYGSDDIKKVFLSTVIGNEGSAPSNNRWRIQFVLSKCKEHVPNLLGFLNQIRAMLSHFGISTSHIQLREQKGRQFHGRFYIKGKENLRKFYNEFSFLYASEKQEVLEDLISTNWREKRDDLVNTQ